MAEQMAGGSWLEGGGEMGALIRAHDWPETPLGPIDAWPQSLRVVVRIMLTSRYAMWMGWGPQLTFLYNDAYAKATLGAKHPWALGRPAREVWAEIWTEIGPRIERVLTTRIATWDEGLQLFLERSGFPEETYHTFSYSPLFDDHGDVGGMFCVVTEETARVLGERQLALLRELAADLATTHTQDEVAAAAERSLGARAQDVPFALIYSFDDEDARLLAAVGAERGSAIAPDVIPPRGGAWPAEEIRERAAAVVVDDLQSRFPGVPRGPWEKPPRQAIVIPIAQQGEQRPGGFLVAGLNPYRFLNREYAGFVELLAGQVAAGLANARAYEAQRKRAEELAEIDRAKTLFFTNISHEFRTPLTLMLGPVGDLLAKGHEGSADHELLRIVQRHTLRLLKLVNTLLDFSRIEAGGSQARFVPTDLGTVTGELASMFRAAVEKAGMRLLVHTPPSRLPLYVDREMWEKIVLNLVSNAFKFTLEGEIEVALQDSGDAAVLTVRDTGSGIPARELPRLFDRFHRVEGTRRRSHEGTGIGLAFVQELVKLHGGTIAVETEEGVGTQFIVTIPAGSAHLPPAQVTNEVPAQVKAPTPEMYVDEASQWIGAEPAAQPLVADAAAGERPRVVLADDNADMREYVRRLLAPQFEVEAVGDGKAALEAIRRRRPDLLLSDVMMPELDGFGLLAAVRAEPGTRDLPVIMLSARAGEESRIEGVEAGADDYLVKPFSARELLARATMQIRMAGLRREAVQREQQLRAEMENILESMADSFVACDSQWRITYMNAAAETINERSRSEVLGRSLWEAFPDARGTEVERLFRRAMEERVPVKADFWYEPYRRWLEADVFPVEGGGIAVYGRDVTQRKRAEDALRESEELFRTLGEAVPDFLWMADAAGRPMYRNPAWARYTGMALEHFDAAGWAEVLHPDDLPQLRRTWQAALESGVPYETEVRVRRRDGVYRWFSGRAVPLRNDDGSPRGWVGTMTDIDDRKRMEDGLRAADRMKDEFVATLSHELRTPLTSILGWTQMLMTNVLDAEDSGNAIAAIERAAKAQAQLVEDVLDVSRITTGRMRIEVEPTELAAVIEAALETVKPAAVAKSMTLAVELDRSIGQAMLDGPRVQQIVWNLLSNAIKFSPANTAVHLALRREGSVATIEVRDEGPGIAPELLPHVFERFWQADSSSRRTYAGLGLGLALVRHLAELHGGQVEVASAVGAGSAFRVTLPLLPVPRSRKRGAGEAGVASRGRLDSVHVLFVDDLQDTRDLFATMLRKEGALVTTAMSVEEARANLQTIRPEIVLTDIAMPGADGYDLLHILRREHPSLPVIALTAHGVATATRAEDVAFDAWLRKPVTQEVVAETILRVLRGR